MSTCRALLLLPASGRCLPLLTTAIARLGHYNAEQWDEGLRAYTPNNNVQIYISVEEVFDNDHRVVSQRGASIKGKFTFSAADSGEHRICFSPIGAATHSGWLSGGQQAGSIRFDLDLAIGETSKIESDDKDKMQDLQQKVRDLNARLQDIRREQVFQRVNSLSSRSVDLTDTGVAGAGSGI